MDEVRVLGQWTSLRNRHKMGKRKPIWASMPFSTSSWILSADSLSANHVDRLELPLHQAAHINLETCVLPPGPAVLCYVESIFLIYSGALN